MCDFIIVSLKENEGNGIENILTPEELELLNKWPPLNGRSEAFWESLSVSEPCSQIVVRYKEKKDRNDKK